MGAMNKHPGHGSSPKQGSVLTPGTPQRTPRTAAEQELRTPHGSKDTHAEMRSVLEDLKTDFNTSASKEAVELMERLEMPTPHSKDAGGATLTALRDELRAAKSAVRVLKLDKEK